MEQGFALGYAVSLFDQVSVPQTEDLIKQVNNISSISEIRYADGSMISAIESDLLRTSVSSDDISDNLKQAIVATEDEHFAEHNGVVPKAVYSCQSRKIHRTWFFQWRIYPNTTAHQTTSGW